MSDQFSTYGTKVIVVTHREAQYVLDGIMGKATDLPGLLAAECDGGRVEG